VLWEVAAQGLVIAQRPAAGLEQALDFLEDVRFQPEDISFLRRHSVFAHVSDAFFDYLRTFRFTGEVWAVPEGTPVLPNCPLTDLSATATASPAGVASGVSDVEQVAISVV
jgi:nicotinic acid phosphoribosyltransferase